MPASLATTAIPVRTSAGRKTSIRKLDLDETSSKSYAQQLQEHLCRDAVRVIDLFREWDTDDVGELWTQQHRSVHNFCTCTLPCRYMGTQVKKSQYIWRYVSDP